MKIPLVLLTASILARSLSGAQTRPESPSSADSILGAAVASYYDGNYLRVIDLLQPGPGIPRTAKANYFLGSSFAALNDPQSAVRYLRMAVDSSSGDIAFRFQLAKSLTVLGATGEAGAEYRLILRRDSTFLPALFNLGTLRLDGRDYAGAADLFARGVQLNPRDFLSYYNLGASLVNMGKPDSAVQFLRASLALNLRYGPTLGLLASLYYKRKEYQDAGRLYAMLVAKDSTNADAWERWGYCTEKLGESPWSLHCFLTASRLDTSNSTYCARVGQACFELKKYDSAAAFYLRAAFLEEENPVLFLNAGFSFARMDSLEKALGAFRMSYTAHHIERLGLLYSQMAGIYYTQKRYRRAAGGYLKALQYDPGNTRCVFFLARSQDEMRDSRAAAASYGRFLKRAGNDPGESDIVPYARKRLKELNPGR